MALDLNTLKNNVNDLVAQINNLDIETIEMSDYLTSLEVNESVYSKNETIEEINVDKVVIKGSIDYDIKKDLIPGEYYIVVTKNNIKKTYLINYRNSDFICNDFKIQKNKIITDFEIHVRIRGAKNDSTN